MSSINLSLAAGDAAADFDDETLAEVGEAAEEEVMMTVHKHIRATSAALHGVERVPGYESDASDADVPPPPPIASPARSHKSTQEQTQELFHVPEIPTYLEAKEARHFQRIHIDEFDD